MGVIRGLVLSECVSLSGAIKEVRRMDEGFNVYFVVSL